MKLIIAMLCMIALVGCTEFPTRQLQEVRVVAYVPEKEQGSGISYQIKYAHWIYENTTTKERFAHVDKFGEVGEIVKIRR